MSFGCSCGDNRDFLVGVLSTHEELNLEGARRHADASRRATIDDHQIRAVAGRRPAGTRPMPHKRFLPRFSGCVPHRFCLAVRRVHVVLDGVKRMIVRLTVECSNAVHIGVAAASKRRPHRRGNRRMTTKKNKVVTAGTTINQLLQVRHDALCQELPRQSGVHAIDAQNQDFTVFGFRHLEPLLHYSKTRLFYGRCLQTRSLVDIRVSRRQRVENQPKD